MVSAFLKDPLGNAYAFILSEPEVKKIKLLLLGRLSFLNVGCSPMFRVVIG